MQLCQRRRRGLLGHDGTPPVAEDIGQGGEAMDTYRSAWACFTAPAGIAGVWVSLEEFSLSGVLAILLFVATAAALIRLTRTKADHRPEWRSAVLTGLAWGAAAVAATGLVGWLGLSGLAVVVLLTLLSPMVLTKAFKRSHLSRHGEGVIARRGHDGLRDPAASGQDEVAGSAEVTAVTARSLLAASWLQRSPESMDDTNLCFAWRRSYLALQRSLPLHARLRIVERRQEFLDEFEQRNPRGFSAWLASGARAAGDPSKYIASEQRQGDRHDHP